MGYRLELAEESDVLVQLHYPGERVISEVSMWVWDCVRKRLDVIFF